MIYEFSWIGWYSAWVMSLWINVFRRRLSLSWIKPIPENFWKTMGSQKMNFRSGFHIRGLKGSPLWEDFNYGLRIESGYYLIHILSKNRQHRPELWFKRFLLVFGQNRVQIISKPNSETIFGIPSSRRILLTTNMKVGLIFFLYYFQNFIPCVRDEKAILWGKIILCRCPSSIARDYLRKHGKS